MIMDETMDVSTIHEIPRIEIVFCPDCDTDNEQEAVLCEHHQGMMEGWNSGWDAREQLFKDDFFEKLTDFLTSRT